jgi:uncharacterized protein YhaN
MMENECLKCIECVEDVTSPVTLPCDSLNLDFPPPPPHPLQNTTTTITNNLEHVKMLTTTLTRFTFIQDAAYHLVEEQIELVRKQVECSRDALKADVEARASALLVEIEAYRSECRRNIVERWELVNELRELREELTRRGEEIEALVVSATDGVVKVESEVRELVAKADEVLRERLLLNRFEEFKGKQERFCQLGLVGLEMVEK